MFPRLLIFVLVALAWAGPARASCPCIRFMGTPGANFQDLADGSVSVFEATVDSVTSEQRTLPSGHLDETRTTVLRVFRAWKGSPGERLVLTSTAYDRSFRFEAGRQYLVFALEREGKLFVGQCWGSIPLEEAAVGLRYFETSTGTVCGAVRKQDGSPAAGATVSVWQSAQEKNRFKTLSTLVGADGTYRLGLFSAGKYSLVAMDVRDKPPTRNIGFFQRIVPQTNDDWTAEIEKGKESCGFDIDLVRQPLWNIRGRIHTEDGSPLPQECNVFLQGLTIGHPLSLRKQVQAASDGGFTFEGVPHAALYAYASCFKKNEDGTFWRSRSVWVKRSGENEELALTMERFLPPPRVRPE